MFRGQVSRLDVTTADADATMFSLRPPYAGQSSAGAAQYDGQSQSSQDDLITYRVFLQGMVHSDEDDPRVDPPKAGSICVREVDARVWDRAYERRFNLCSGKTVVGRGRDKHVEIFYQEAYGEFETELQGAIESSSVVLTTYRAVDPPSLYFGKSRSQRSVTERLVDVVYQAMEAEVGDVDFAIIADGSPSNALLIVNMDRSAYHSGHRDLDSLTVNGCIYQVVGYILDSEPRFCLEEKLVVSGKQDPAEGNRRGANFDRCLSKYLGRKGGVDYVEWRWLDRTCEPPVIPSEVVASEEQNWPKNGPGMDRYTEERKKYRQEKRRTRKKSKKVSFIERFQEAGAEASQEETAKVTQCVKNVRVNQGAEGQGVQSGKEYTMDGGSDTSDNETTHGGTSTIPADTLSTRSELESNEPSMDSILTDLRANLKINLKHGRGSKHRAL